MNGRIATVMVHTSPLDQPGMGDAGGIETQRHERWTWWHDWYGELLGDFVAKWRGADLRHGQATGGDDQCGRAEIALRGFDKVAIVVARHTTHAAVHQ